MKNTSTGEALVDASITPVVRGFVHRASERGGQGDGLVFTHGAGSNCNAPMLVAFAEAFSRAGITVLRCDLPYRQKRASGPPRNSAEDRAGLRNAALAMRGMVPGRVFLGGQSYGGRQATMLVAEEPGLVDGLIICSYPLHPPGKPEQMRTAHLPNLRIPTLFVHGSQDPFATYDEMQQALKLIPVPTSLIEIEGAGHDLYGRGKNVRSDLPDLLLSNFGSFFAPSSLRAGF